MPRQPETPAILIVGCGSIGGRHARNLRRLGVSRLLLVDPDATRRETLAREIDGDPYATLGEALREEPAAAVVCSPTSFHLAVAREALASGCDLLIEKPLSHTLDGVDDFVAEVAAGDRVVMVGYNLRFNRVVEQVRSWLDEDRIGRPTSARLHFGSDLARRHPWEDYRAGYGARVDLGGGVLLDAIHELDAALLYLGAAQSIFCHCATLGELEVDVEDTAELVIEFDHACASVHLDYLEWPPRRFHQLRGPGGRIVADLIDGTATLYSDAGKIASRFSDPDRDSEYLREAEHFLRCLQRRAVPPVDATGAIASLSLVIAAKESSSTRRSISVPALAATTK